MVILISRQYRDLIGRIHLKDRLPPQFSLNDIFYLLIKKNASKADLFDRRQRQGMRQRLRHVSMDADGEFCR
jgi:hypothetical protein